ncbi:DUF998 domain-containing protein [Halorubellus salinus]|uniref:DUF998 domain-containing protein n=1 Tax=Halorubellus salinus TaxID=755309 RepID=UPI001D06C729|nr:DUF998 domain-containing protein [Halorubellus salinus]
MTETTFSETLPAESTTGTVRAQRRAGVILAVLSAQFMTVIMLAAAMVPGYDFGASAISDLGVFPESAWLFNASLVLVGLLNVAGGYYYYRVHGKRWLFGVFALAGLGAVVAGAVPLDAGDLHSLGALFAFLFFNVQAIGVGTQVRGAMRYASVLAGIVGIAFLGIMIVGDAGNPAVFGAINHGGAERMIVYPAMLWLVAFGGYLLGRGESTTVA